MDQSSARSTKLDPSSLADFLGRWSAGDGPLYRQLVGAVEALVDDGTIRAGDQLPAERALADALAVSRGTVVRAYDSLADAGRVRRVQGSGTTVAGNRIPAAAQADDFVGDPLWAANDDAISFLKAIPSLLPEVHDAITSVDLAAHGADLDTAEPLGWWSLRSRIADHCTADGLPTTPHQIMVTSGAQQALALTIRSIVHPGDVVLGEEHTWPGLIDLVVHQGARYVPVQMDAGGVDAVQLERLVERYRPGLVVLNPQNHNPTGSRMADERVAEIARIARDYRVPVAEDRVAANIGFDRRRLPAIADHDTGGHDVTLDSLCKVAWPGLRLGWVRADAQLISRMRAHKAVDDMFCSLLSQAAGLAVLDRYEAIIAARVDQLRPRLDVLTEALDAELPEWSYQRPRGGLSVWVTLPTGVSADAFVRHAARHGVLVASARQFGAEAVDSRQIRLPFTAPEVELAEGMRRLVGAWHSFDRTTTARSLSVV